MAALNQQVRDAIASARTEDLKEIARSTITDKELHRAGDRRAAQILDGLKTYQMGVANEIYTLFEERSRQLDQCLVKIREMENAYYQVQVALKEKDNEILHIKTELENYIRDRKKYESQVGDLSSEIERLRLALHEAEVQHRAISDDKARLDVEYRSHLENAKVLETEITRYKTVLKDSEERFSAILRAKDEELRQLTSGLNDVKSTNSKIIVNVKERESDIYTLRKTVEGAAHLQRVITDKESELRNLGSRYTELQRLYEEQKRIAVEKDKEIARLEAETREMRTRYTNSKRSNAVLMKKVIVLSEEMPYVSDEDSDDDLRLARTGLQERLDNLRSLYSSAAVPTSSKMML